MKQTFKEILLGYNVDEALSKEDVSRLAQELADSLSVRSNMITLLDQYSEFLCKNGYMDSDWKDEEPYAIDEFLKQSP